MQINNINDINLRELIEKETGERFNKENKIHSPFNTRDKNPSFSIYYNAKACKWCFKDFSTGEYGDCVDFIMKYKNMDYKQARVYLGLSAKQTEQELRGDKVRNYIDWQLKNWKDMKGYSFSELYEFTDMNNNVIYYKAKFKKSDGKKKIQYYHIKNDGKVESKRGTDEVPFNQYRLIQGVKNNKGIFICEGEKDCLKLSHMGYTATSFKGVTEFEYSLLTGAKVYIIPDNDEAGERYKDELFKKLKDYVKEFNVVYPKNWSSYKKGYDVTDWLEDGHNKEDLEIAISDKWDYKKSMYWRDFDIKNTKDGEKIIPRKTWRNVEQVLKRNGISLRYNLVSNTAESTGTICSSGDELIIDILTLCLNNGLNVNKDVVCDAILKMSRENEYNPFLDFIKANKNDNYNIIEDMFNCLVVRDEFIANREKYLLYFKTWLMDLIQMAHNTLENGYKSQGVLVLQGKQGCRKSTFFKQLMPNNHWFKGEADINPKDRDNIWQNTSYVLVELSEFDGMSKKDQESLKRFLTNELDVYRVPYGRCNEKHPRLTTFCATVNPIDFLKDKTGSRRFWIIPVEECNIEEMQKININEFWGAVYSLWCSKTVKNYLDADETETLLQDNTTFNMENDITIAIDETFDFEQPKELWRVYSLGELKGIIGIYEVKAIKNELERRRLKYSAHRDKYSDKVKKGFKLPNIYKEQGMQKSPLSNHELKVVTGPFR
nr:MAG TPA: virulence associated protein E [Caudoviricetes sp.]